MTTDKKYMSYEDKLELAKTDVPEVFSSIEKVYKESYTKDVDSPLYYMELSHLHAHWTSLPTTTIN